MEKIAVIAGAGPAGLTAALELLQRSDVRPLVFESDTQVGGISKTINYRGNRMDLGGHRFFSKSDWVMNWWQSLLPVAGDVPAEGRHSSSPTRARSGAFTAPDRTAARPVAPTERHAGALATVAHLLSPALFRLPAETQRRDAWATWAPPTRRPSARVMSRRGSRRARPRSPSRTSS